MLRALLIFGAGWYFGRNQNAAGQVIGAGKDLLETATRQPGVRPVIPGTAIISPEKAAGCPAGYTYWPALGKCLSPDEDRQARESYEKTGKY